MRSFTPLIATLYLLACCVGNASANEAAFSNIAADERVVFFRTAAWLDVEKDEWHIPLHGWIYEPEDSFARKSAFTALLKNEFDLVADKKTEKNLERRLNLLIADNERDKQIIVAVAGHHYALPASKENGHFNTTLVIPASTLSDHVVDSSLKIQAVVEKTDSRLFTGEVLLIGPTGLSIISDIDDTVKISNVTDRRSLLEYTFLLDFVAAPGMSQLFRQWSEEKASFHFVSSSPWQLYDPLVEFLDKNGFPPAAISLKAVRFRDETLLDLFKKGTETKPKAIEEVLDAFPERRFILVGDSGEHDPEVYAALMRKYPEKILRALIRNVTNESPDNERFKEVFSGIDESRWSLLPQGDIPCGGKSDDGKGR